MKHLCSWIMLSLVLLTAVSVSAQEPENGILFVDDFQGGQDQAWTITDAWQTQDMAGRDLFIARGPGLAWVTGGGNWTNYIFRSAVRLEQGTLALSFRVTQEGRYIVQYREDGLYLVKEYPQETFVVLDQSPFDTPELSAWHFITIGCEDGRIQVYIDKALWLDYVDPSPLLKGTVGVGTLDDSFAGVNSVLVMELLHPLPEVLLPLAQSPPSDEAGQGESQEEAPDQRGPEMTISDVTVSNDHPQAGESITIWLTVINTGETIAEDFDFIIIPTYTPEGPNNPGGIQIIPALSPGESITLETNTFYSTPNTYTLRSLATNEWYLTGNLDLDDNAIWDTPITVVDVAAQPEASTVTEQPDLIVAVASATVVESPPNTMVVNYTVHNVGGMDAGAFTVRWYPHGRSDVVGCSEDINFLGAGQAMELYCIYTYPQRGNMHWRVDVDADDDIVESDEANNIWNGATQVGDAG